MSTAREPAENRLYPPANPLDEPVRVRLRREKIAARLALAPAEHARLSGLLETRLEQAFAHRAAGVVAFCWPIRGEFDARPLAGRLLAKGWRAAIPTVIQPATPMVFRAWTPGAPMAADPFGIPIPAADAACLVPDVVLLPLVAFAENGFRLGYGGGYFDRTLAAMVPRPLAWGVGFELALTAGLRPEPHDIPLDAVISECGIRRFARA